MAKKSTEKADKPKKTMKARALKKSMAPKVERKVPVVKAKKIKKAAAVETNNE
jgi:hypothetical protein